MSDIFGPLDRFLRNLPQGGGDEIVLLKCHLLIEEVLTKIIENASKQPKYIAQADLRFAQKIILARSLSEPGNNVWIWGALKKINSARNALGHSLNRDDVNDKIEDFASFVEKEKHRPGAEMITGSFGRLHWAAFVVYTILSSQANYDPTEYQAPTLLSSLLVDGA